MIFFLLFGDTATIEIYTLSLHDALPILLAGNVFDNVLIEQEVICHAGERGEGHTHFTLTGSGNLMVMQVHLDAGCFHGQDRKSTRLNSSHSQISYAVFCLKKKRPRMPSA